MKKMRVSYHSGANFPKFGRRMVPISTGTLKPDMYGASKDGWFSRPTSHLISHLVFSEMEAGRAKWAQLCVQISEHELYFWTPSELDHVCAVFAENPFPTARTLVRRDGADSALNMHWLSRLPKAMKAEKFRQKFLKFVASNPEELRLFREFYSTA
ncbi:hypothetical protein [Roseobacter sp. SK209-2-6]|uniref:hypothetical protein n=1 Tax=Roseobacter sp. SK209-2-6 TaxID=388739 RepID=UPI0012F497DA|nr:hypothetical protein [Roseobacter sp. SK209-2-6]